MTRYSILAIPLLKSSEYTKSSILIKILSLQLISGRGRVTDAHSFYINVLPEVEQTEGEGQQACAG